jgi:hypothetical protein
MIAPFDSATSLGWRTRGLCKGEAESQYSWRHPLEVGYLGYRSEEIITHIELKAPSRQLPWRQGPQGQALQMQALQR